MRWATAISPRSALPALEGGEVEALHGLLYEPAMVLRVEHLADDALGRRDVRSATSARIWPIARAVSASICLRVSSSLRWRSVSASFLARSTCASATLRVSARMSADSERACARIARFCSSSCRASLRALSASSTACRMRSRRSSIVFWMGPKAYFLSTKNAIPKQMSVQIMRPGTTSIRPLPPSSESAVCASRVSIGSGLRSARRRAGRRSGRRTRPPRRARSRATGCP